MCISLFNIQIYKKSLKNTVQILSGMYFRMERYYAGLEMKDFT